MHPRILQQNIVEKMLRDREGRLARVTLHVYENAGTIQARVLKVEYISVDSQTAVLALGGFVAENAVIPEKGRSFDHVVSPFVDSSLIFTLGLQPRAPTFK